MGSGPLDAANLLFRKRLLLVNTAQYFHGLPFNKGSYAIFKQVYSKNKKRFLSLKEYLLEAKNINNKLDIIDLVILSKLEKSKSEIRRLIKGKAIKINDKIISDEKLIITNEFFKENYLKLSIGKKRHLKIELD